MSRQQTQDQLLLTAIDLIAKKGYKAVTTQEIATAAGFSEKTLFRHFGSKQNLLEVAFDRFHYGPEMKELFANKIVWDLRKDLLLISQTYHENMNRNRKMIEIAIKEAAHMPGFRERTHKAPQQLKEFLISYFQTMMKQGKIIQTNPELQAVMFMTLHFGAFTNQIEVNEGISLNEFIHESVKLFTRALTP